MEEIAHDGFARLPDKADRARMISAEEIAGSSQAGIAAFQA
jgi:hypothetical protein